MKLKFLKSLKVLIMSVICVSAYAHAASDFPKKPIQLIVPFSAGGGTDVVARALAQKVGQELGVAIVVNNKPGANGTIAARELVHAAADGYTLLYNTSSLVISPSLYKEVGYDYEKDLEPIIKTAQIPLVLVVNPKLPVNTLPEFIAYLKKNPNTFYGSGGNGNISHLGIVQLLSATGTTATHVPYKGGSGALSDTAAGQVQFFLDSLNSSLPLIKGKRVKALAVTSSKRANSLPDVPTVAESTVPGFSIDVWQGVVAPAGTPPEVVAKLNQAFNDALKDKTLRQQLLDQDAEPAGSTVQEYGSFLQSEFVRWAEIVELAKIEHH